MTAGTDLVRTLAMVVCLGCQLPGNVTGALQTARDGDFRELEYRYPHMLRVINVSRIPVAPNRFEHFAGYCCDSPACGPYLEDACADLGLPVRHRQLSQDGVREFHIEIIDPGGRGLGASPTRGTASPRSRWSAHP